jgi:hypothetical protein
LGDILLFLEAFRVEVNTGSMTSGELGWASAFVARLAEFWPDDYHQETGKLFAELAQALTDCQVDHELRIARLGAAHADDWSTRVALGMADPDDPPKLGWTGEEGLSQREIGDVLGVSKTTVDRDLEGGPNGPPEPEEPQVSEPDNAEPGPNGPPEPPEPDDP